MMEITKETKKLNVLKTRKDKDNSRERERERERERICKRWKYQDDIIYNTHHVA